MPSRCRPWSFAAPTPEEFLPQIEQNAEWLQKNQITDGPRRGAWSYADRESALEGNGDNSNAQFALLALYEAQRAFDATHAKVHVNDRTWRLAKAYWEGCQNLDGSWGYYKDVAGTGSMTCAGISSLIIASDMVHQADAKADGDHIRCCMQGDVENDRIEQGITWLGKHFTVTGNPGNTRLWWLYYLYGVERVGRLTARRFIGSHDWYREGADCLVREQGHVSDGSWKGPGHAEQEPVIGTSLALLFLSKGRRPVLLAKLRHGPGEDWNQHRSDVGNLTAYVETKWQRDLTWQVIDLAGASVDDLMQVPVLYLCGNQSPLPDGPQQQRELAQKLRGYLDRGGFLFAEGYCGGEGFDRGFRELMTRVFANEPEYRLTACSTRRIRSGTPKRRWRRTSCGRCWGSSSAAARAWSMPRPIRRMSRGRRCRACGSCRGAAGSSISPPRCRRRSTPARAIGINVLAYATNREVKWKDEQPATLAAAEPARPGRAGTDLRRQAASPRRLRRGAAGAGQPDGAAARELKIRVDLPARAAEHHRRRPVRLPPGLHARPQQLPPDRPERAAVEDLRRAGRHDPGRFDLRQPGVHRVVPPGDGRHLPRPSPGARFPANDPLLTTAYGGFDLSRVSRREPQPRRRRRSVERRRAQGPPELEGIKFDDRYAVIFSPFDLSCALEKHDSLECRGYSREDAARIGLNVLLYSLQSRRRRSSPPPGRISRGRACPCSDRLRASRVRGADCRARRPACPGRRP